MSDRDRESVRIVVAHDKVPGAPARFLHPSAAIGPFSSVWWYSVVQAEAVIGEGCNIGAHCEIGRGAVIGDRSRIGAHTFLPPNTRIGADVFVGPHVMMCDDKHPRIHRQGDAPYVAEPPVIEDGAVIGAAAVLLPGVRIGAGARVCAGAVVTRDVLPGEVVAGLPARAKALSAASVDAWALHHAEEFGR